MKSPIGLMIHVMAWGMATYAATEEVPGPPMAYTVEKPSHDVDQDGIRDRYDPVIDFGKVKDRYRGKYGINVQAFSWDAAVSRTCLDSVCEAENFSRLVTVPDGGTFALFRLPDGLNVDFPPWNPGNPDCLDPHFPGPNNECWADLTHFAPDPLLAEVEVNGRIIRTLRLPAVGPDS